MCGVVLAASAFFSSPSRGQQSQAATPVVVQPGAPGKPSKTLPASTKGTLPPLSQEDVEFMQGMIMHHAQAVEMTALIPSHTENKELRELGAQNQQFAVGRDQVHEAVAGGTWTSDFHERWRECRIWTSLANR